jgi:AraC family transcriptional regulator
VEEIEMDGGLSVEFELPRIENGRPLLLAGLKEWYNRDTVKDIPAQWQRLNPYLGNIRGKVGHAAYGVVFDRRGGVDGFHYLSGVEVSELFGLAGELSSVIIPALK